VNTSNCTQKESVLNSRGRAREARGG
jgi:hypothetical protein